MDSSHKILNRTKEINRAAESEGDKGGTWWYSRCILTCTPFAASLPCHPEHCCIKTRLVSWTRCLWHQAV